MRDFLPADKARRERVLRRIIDGYTKRGFRQVETPVMEEASRLHAGLGGDNEKLAFGVLRRGLTGEDLSKAAESGDVMSLMDLGLRYDLTVPLARFYASHRAELPGVFRAIQAAPVWRAERPQAGRYRQFMQCDIDIIGEPGILAEAELVTATLGALADLGLTGVTVRINDRRLLTAMLNHFGFAEDVHAAVLITVDKLDKIGPDGVLAELRERGHDEAAVAALGAFLMRPQTLEFRPFGEGQIRKGLPDGVEHEAIADLVQIGEAVAAGLGTDSADISGVPLVFDPFLVRGMGYYTGAIFELAHPTAGFSLGGGGRYDGMIGRFLGTDVPAVGFSIGFERIIDLVELGADAEPAVALLYDKAVSPVTLLRLEREFVEAGRPVVLMAAPKKVASALDRLAVDGVGEFAFVRDDAATAATLDLRPLAARDS